MTPVARGVCAVPGIARKAREKPGGGSGQALLQADLSAHLKQRDKRKDQRGELWEGGGGEDDWRPELQPTRAEVLSGHQMLPVQEVTGERKHSQHAGQS